MITVRDWTRKYLYLAYETHPYIFGMKLVEKRATYTRVITVYIFPSDEMHIPIQKSQQRAAGTTNGKKDSNLTTLILYMEYIYV